MVAPLVPYEQVAGPCDNMKYNVLGMYMHSHFVMYIPIDIFTINDTHVV